MAINQNIPKVDGLGLITGKPAYTDDLAPNDALIVKVLRSPYAYARIKGINTEKASNVKGISLILTQKHWLKQKPTMCLKNTRTAGLLGPIQMF